jgi:hypothetical protein
MFAPRLRISEPSALERRARARHLLLVLENFDGPTELVVLFEFLIIHILGDDFDPYHEWPQSLGCLVLKMAKSCAAVRRKKHCERHPRGHIYRVKQTIFSLFSGRKALAL